MEELVTFGLYEDINIGSVITVNISLESDNYALDVNNLSLIVSSNANDNLSKDPAYDLYLMALCKHFVLSLSTLHYWGAYLSKNYNRVC